MTILLLSACTADATFEGGFVSNARILPALQFSDVNPNNDAQVIVYYDRQILNNTGYPNIYEIEYVFLDSLLTELTMKRDLYNLRLIAKETNEMRSLLKFVDSPEGGNPHVYMGGFFPGDEEIGDVTRILMYMANTYELDLSLT